MLGFGKPKISPLDASAYVLFGLVWQAIPDSLEALIEIAPESSRRQLIRELVCLQYFAATVAIQDSFERNPDLKTKLLKAMDIMNAVLCSSEKDLPPQVPQAVIEHAKTFATSALRRFLELGDESTRLALREALASAPDRSFFTARMDAYDSAFMRRGGNLQHGLEDAAREFARLATAQPEIFAASHATIVVMTQFAAVRDTLASYRIR